MSDIGIDPAKDAEDIATGALTSLCKAGLGDIVGPVVANDVVSFVTTDISKIFGLEGGPSVIEKELDKIESQLSAIADQLKALQASVDRIQSTCNEILADVQALQRQLKQAVIDLELQPLLQALFDRATVINENFATYVNAIAAMAGSDQGRRVQGVLDLSQIFSLTNLEKIAIEVRKAHGLISPQLEGVKSLPELYVSRLECALDSVVLNLEPFRPKAWFPSEQLLVLGGELLKASVAAGNSELRMAARTFQLYALLQLQGFALLTAGWIHTDQAPQVVNLVQKYTATVSALTQFRDVVLNGGQGNWPGMERYLQTAVTTAADAGRIGHPFRWYVIDDVHGPDPTKLARGIPVPVDANWSLWSEGSGQDGAIIATLYRPWGPDGDLPWLHGSPPIRIHAGKSATISYRSNGGQNLQALRSLWLTVGWHSVPAGGIPDGKPPYELPADLDFIQELAAFRLPS
jgi:hypothetical protein